MDLVEEVKKLFPCVVVLWCEGRKIILCNEVCRVCVIIEEVRRKFQRITMKPHRGLKIGSKLNNRGALQDRAIGLKKGFC